METDTQAVPAENPLDYLYTKSLKCPVCKKEFLEFLVRKSKIRTISVDSDFKMNCKTIDPNHYEVFLCNFCGYSALQSYFERITEKQQQLILSEISPKHTPMEFPVPLSAEHVLLRFKQALACANAIKAKSSQRAIICLKMAWVYRDLEKKREETLLLKNAFAGLKEAYTTENFPLGAMDEHTTIYVMAELAFRIGEYEESLRLCGNLIVNRAAPQGLRDKAGVLKDKIKENEN